MEICKVNPEWDKLINEMSMNSTSIAYGLFTPEGKLIFANSTMCHYLGTNITELQAQNNFINPNFEKIVTYKSSSDLVFEGLLTIGDYTNKHYVLNSKIFKRNNAYLVFAEADVFHLFEENGKMSSLNQEVNNLQRQLIKEKRTLQQTLNKLRETQQLLIHSEKMNALGQMIAGIAHEINNPIAFVTNNLYELEKYSQNFITAYHSLELEVEKNASQELKNSVQRIREENEIDYITEDMTEIISESKMGVERVKKIVEDLRKFSRLDEAEIKRIDLASTIDSTLTIVKSEIAKKNIQFSFDSTQKIMVDCYPGQLNQAILNVLVNAIQAVDNGGKILLQIKEEENQVMISVEDNGIGIPKQNMSKIFDPFFSTKPVGSGTGLGLSITDKIINDLHKGKIDVYSEVDKGTIFKLMIPKEIKK